MSSLREDLAIGPADTQKAYDEANRLEFMGRRLEPWTVRRHSVALQLRSRLMRGMNDDENSLSKFMDEGFYPHLFHDLVVILYLMHLNPIEVVELERLTETEAMHRAYSWAESIPINYGTPIFFEGAKILGKLLRSISVSWFAVKKKDEVEPEKKISNGDTDPPGRLNLSLEPSGPAVLMPITS